MTLCAMTASILINYVGIRSCCGVRRLLCALCIVQLILRTFLSKFLNVATRTNTRQCGATRDIARHCGREVGEKGRSMRETRRRDKEEGSWAGGCTDSTVHSAHV